MSQKPLVIQCASCDQVAPAKVEVRLEVTCSCCGAAALVEPEVSRPSAVPGAVPGLGGAALDHSGPGIAEGSAAPLPQKTGVGDSDLQRLVDLVDDVENISQELADRYRQAVQQGDDRQSHAELIQFASATQQLNQAGTIYRRRLEQFPQDALAQQMRDQIIKAAMLTMGPNTNVEDKRKKGMAIGTMLAVFFFLSAMFIAAYVMAGIACPDSFEGP